MGRDPRSDSRMTIMGGLVLLLGELSPLVDPVVPQIDTILSSGCFSTSTL